MTALLSVKPLAGMDSPIGSGWFVIPPRKIIVDAGGDGTAYQAVPCGCGHCLAGNHVDCARATVVAALLVADDRWRNEGYVVGLKDGH
jgi:hypothetical protein